MKPAKAFGDYAVRTVEETADDEYQREMLHKSNTVSAEAEPFIMAAVFAALAWTLPGVSSICAVLAVLPTMFAQLTGQYWLRSYAPRPRPRRMLTKANIPFFVLWTLGLVGIAFNAFGNSESGRTAMVVGVATATLLTLTVGPAIALSGRNADERRLNAEFED
ncbi:hypothetical protein [uncultured Corynebacterium sp.]|uniref:hypothetical protein n=1 Tax=uncultured Corynebacterium sp. TaxID=159447 RepID=UPI002593E041|nr:hypothetical protein [uncultured Corynebacterium sp.]